MPARDAALPRQRRSSRRGCANRESGGTPESNLTLRFWRRPNFARQCSGWVDLGLCAVLEARQQGQLRPARKRFALAADLRLVRRQEMTVPIGGYRDRAVPHHPRSMPSAWPAGAVERFLPGRFVEIWPRQPLSSRYRRGVHCAHRFKGV